MLQPGTFYENRDVKQLSPEVAPRTTVVVVGICKQVSRIHLTKKAKCIVLVETRQQVATFPNCHGEIVRFHEQVSWGERRKLHAVHRREVFLLSVVSNK